MAKPKLNGEIMSATKILEKFIRIVVVAVVTFSVLEMVSWFAAIRGFRHKYDIPEHPYKYMLKSRKIITFDELYKQISDKLVRGPSGLEYNARPIVIFGCSFAYGLHLKYKETLSYKISEKMKMPVFNRAIDGAGVQHMLWQLKNEKFLDTIKNPKYIIYVWINDQMRRLDMYGWLYKFMFTGPYLVEYLRYKEKGGHLVEVHDMFPLSRNLLLVNLFMYWRNKSESKKFLSNTKFRDKKLNILGMHFLESKKLVGKKWPNAKFIIIDYDDGRGNYIHEYADFWEKIEKKGFIYINVKNSFNVGSYDEKYRLSDYHPNEHAWDVIVPQLVKKLEKIK